MPPSSFPLFLLLLTVMQEGIAQVTVTKLTRAELPKEIKFRGRIVDAHRYKDTLGQNLVIRTETGIYRTRADIENSTNSARLYAYHYTLNEDSAQLTWTLTDHILACELDLSANFIENAFSMTDLDNDGIAETWLVYQTYCRGDVSPGTLKIIMYEGVNKYAMRGARKIPVSPTEVLGGKYSFDKAFLNAADTFRNYAKKLWKKYEPEAMEAL